jgi:multidrug efflux pump subunit AcrA (membrane-fusion protein)
VKKGDPVRKGQVVVLLDDSEQRARLAEAEGRLARAQASQTIAKTRFNRLKTLREQRVESEQQLDDALAELNAAEAGPGGNRQKGTLEVKVQVKNPDRYLVPELSAKVDFLGAYPQALP